MEPSVRMLGVPRRLVAGGDELALPPGQATHLAAYLLLRDDWVPRDELAALFWPEADAPRARHNLSQLLYSMRRSAWADDVQAEPRRLRWRPESDVLAFRRAVGDGDWARATGLYAGELLEGVEAPASGPFESWLAGEREDLAAAWREAALEYSAELRRSGRCADAVPLLRRLLKTDDLLEDAVDALMRCEAELGRRETALRTFDRFRDRLHDELGLEPLASTLELAARLRAGDGAAAAGAPRTGDTPAGSAPVRDPSGGSAAGANRALRAGSVSAMATVVSGPRVRGLPEDATAFVGREAELEQVRALFVSPDHRALTVVGPGGAGKTRLARRLARELGPGFRDGGAWVPLETASDELGVVRSVAGALGIRAAATLDELASALAEHELLLALDNVEHLDGMPGVVATLLEGGPDLRLLLTSRSPLDVPGETVYRLPGLSLPERDDAADAESYDAVALFVRAARRVRPDFHPRGDEHRAMVTLTRVLAGSPLALELAASWAGLLEPSELLAEVRRDLDVLRSDRDDVPRRHSSLRAAFESSWSLLGDGEREALKRLAVFHGGCSRDSALAVADVALASLLALANRSLLHRGPGGRFLAHPMVQRLLRERLGHDPALQDELERRHGAYFLALARRADGQLDGREQPVALRALDAEIGNLERALERHLEAGREADAHALAAALGRYWGWRGRSLEALAWYRRLRDLPGDGAATPDRVRVLRNEGMALAAVGRFDDAQRTFEAALAGARELGDVRLAAWADRDRATVAWRHGDLTLARELLEGVVARLRELDDEAALAGVVGNLGNVLRDQGDLAGAHRHYDASLALAEEVGNVWEVANTLNNKAIAHAYAGDLEAAGDVFERSLELRRGLDHRPGILTCVTNLGNVALDTDNWEGARTHYLMGVELARELDDREAMTHLLSNLGILAQWEERFDEAHDLYGRALELRRELGLRGMVPQSLACFADLEAARGDGERALVLAGAVRTQCVRVGVPLTAPQQETYQRMRDLARGGLTPDEVDALEARGAAMTVNEAVHFALHRDPGAA